MFLGILLANLNINTNESSQKPKDCSLWAVGIAHRLIFPAHSFIFLSYVCVTFSLSTTYWSSISSCLTGIVSELTPLCSFHSLTICSSLTRVLNYPAPPQPLDQLWRPSWERTWTPCWSSTCWAGQSTVSRWSPPTPLDPATPFQGGPRPVSNLMSQRWSGDVCHKVHFADCAEKHVTDYSLGWI